VRAFCPELLYAEVANGLLVLCRAGALTARRSRDVIDAVMNAPFESEPVRLLAAAAFRVASERSITAYDACYVVLAETRDAILLTSDRRLADASPNAVLITG
jgi:predicted nucleic acid-binding protein